MVLLNLNIIFVRNREEINIQSQFTSHMNEIYNVNSGMTKTCKQIASCEVKAAIDDKFLWTQDVVTGVLVVLQYLQEVRK